MAGLNINIRLLVIMIFSFSAIVSSDHNQGGAASNPFERCQRIVLNENGDYVEHSLTHNGSRGRERGREWIESADGDRIYREVAENKSIGSGIVPNDLLTSSSVKIDKK